MESTEIFKKVRKIEIKTRGLSNHIFSGQYHSAFKGRGMTFSEVREYEYGDDIRNIDWNVTARFNRPFVKIFEEEREMTVMLLIDVSGSNDFGSQSQSKRDLTAELAAVLAFSAIQNNDKVGVIFFSSKIEKFIPPKKGSSHILRIIREIVDFKPVERGTDIGEGLRFLTSAIKRRTTAFLISDFMTDQSFEKEMQICANKHDLVALAHHRPPRDGHPEGGFGEIPRCGNGQGTLGGHVEPRLARCLPADDSLQIGGTEPRVYQTRHRQLADLHR